MKKMIKGVLLPLITPFKDYAIDYPSFKKLIEHYINKGVHGLVVLGTTGECPTLSESESREIIEKTVEWAAGRVQIFAGVSCNDTAKAVKIVKSYAAYPLAGLLVTTPYYNRPSQEGLYNYYHRISETTSLDMLVYNIPYRTGVNLENKTLLRLAELPNIAGIKDSCGSVQQSLELLMNRPADFSVLTGEDVLFLLNLTHGGQGGIMAAAHVDTESYIKIYELCETGNSKEALHYWQKIYSLIPLLFKEPNPAPVKYLLEKAGLIAKAETREPLTPISGELKSALDGLCR